MKTELENMKTDTAVYNKYIEKYNHRYNHRYKKYHCKKIILFFLILHISWIGPIKYVSI